MWFKLQMSETKKSPNYDWAKQAGMFQSSVRAVKTQEFQFSEKAHICTYPEVYNVRDCNAIK